MKLQTGNMLSPRSSWLLIKYVSTKRHNSRWIIFYFSNGLRQQKGPATVSCLMKGDVKELQETGCPPLTSQQGNCTMPYFRVKTTCDVCSVGSDRDYNYYWVISFFWKVNLLGRVHQLLLASNCSASVHCTVTSVITGVIKTTRTEMLRITSLKRNPLI